MVKIFPPRAVTRSAPTILSLGQSAPLTSRSGLSSFIRRCGVSSPKTMT